MPERIVKGIETLFGLAKEDVKTFIMLIFMFLTVYLYVDNRRLNDLRIKDKDNYHKEIVSEIEKRLPKEVATQIEPLKDTVMSVSKDIRDKINTDEKAK